MSFDNKWITIDYWFNGVKGNWSDLKHQWGSFGPNDTDWYPGWGDKLVGEGDEITNQQTLSPNNNPSSWEQTTGIFSMDFGGNSLSIKFYDTGLFKYYLWNGPAFSDVNNNLPPIVGFSLTTNMSFLTKDDIKILDDGNTVFIDWHWGTFDKSTFVQLDFAFANVVTGNSKGNTLRGTKAVDYVTGGKGADIMSGGKDADVFIFRKGDTGSTKKKADLIADFSAKQGDRIDLHKWDADTTTKGIQDFDFIGKDKFTKEAGELRYQKSGSETLLMGDTNGDGKTDFMIRFKGSITFTDDLLSL